MRYFQVSLLSVVLLACGSQVVDFPIGEGSTGSSCPGCSDRDSGKGVDSLPESGGSNPESGGSGNSKPGSQGPSDAGVPTGNTDATLPSCS